MRWSELNDEQKALLAAWFTLADAEKPLNEDLPLEFSTAIAEVAAAAGKYHPRRFIRQHMEAGVPVNRRRRVRARKRRGQLT